MPCYGYNECLLCSMPIGIQLEYESYKWLQEGVVIYDAKCQRTFNKDNDFDLRWEGVINHDSEVVKVVLDPDWLMDSFAIKVRPELKIRAWGNSFHWRCYKALLKTNVPIDRLLALTKKAHLELKTKKYDMQSNILKQLEEDGTIWKLEDPKVNGKNKERLETIINFIISKD